ncbi:MAG: hypothetical protein ACLPZR_33365 [Solirubrobacteraceae bacterium]
MPDRQDFLNSLTKAIGSPLGGELVDGLVAPGTVKTRLLEAHPAEMSPDGAKALLSETAERLELRASKLGDELWALHGADHTFFVDTLNPRFWQLHATAPADKVNRVVREAVATDPRLDTGWLPKTLLRQLDGHQHHLRIAFDADELLGRDEAVRRTRVRFEGEAPEGLLDLLGSDKTYAGATSVIAVGSRVGDTSVGVAQVVADYRGAFVTAAGDFEVAANAIWRMLDRYEAFVRGLEARYRIVVNPLEGEGLTIDGDVAVIAFGREVDVERLVAGLFLAKEPFRLWAVPRQVDDDEWVADAVDLHVGQPLRLEFSSIDVRVLLEPETCGNTLARLLTNLQQHLDARTQLVAA